MTQVERMYLDNGGKLDAYAWPGGYPVYYLDKRNDVLCPKCAQAIFEANRADALLVALGAELGQDEFDEDGFTIGPDPVLSAMRDASGWESTREAPIVYGTRWEGPPIVCEECQAEIPSAYGDPDDESEED